MEQNLKNNENIILKNRRKQLGLTQQEIARRAEIFCQQYQRFESGERSLLKAYFITACKIIDALEMNISDFYQGKYNHLLNI